jgi:hypothetical protein
MRIPRTHRRLQRSFVGRPGLRGKDGRNVAVTGARAPLGQLRRTLRNWKRRGKCHRPNATETDSATSHRSEIGIGQNGGDARDQHLSRTVPVTAISCWLWSSWTSTSGTSPAHSIRRLILRPVRCAGLRMSRAGTRIVARTGDKNPPRCATRCSFGRRCSRRLGRPDAGTVTRIPAPGTTLGRVVTVTRMVAVMGR